MRSFTLQFSAWIAAAACILAIEVWIDCEFHSDSDGFEVIHA